MAKGGAKVQQDDELDELSYDDLVEMLNDADEFMTKEKAKLKELRLKFSSLQDSYEELKTSHENLKETHEKLEEAHNALLNHERKATLSIGVSCDLIDDKPCDSSSTSSSCTKIDDSSCNESLIMENNLLKKEVTCLTNDLRKCYDSRAMFNHCWASQKFTLNKQGVGYISKKGKKAFVHTKTTFVKSSGKSYCEKCKKVGHVEKNCTNMKVISFDSSYILMRNSNGNVSAKFVGIPIDGAKKNAIWVPKVLVTNVQGPKKVWVPKRVVSLL
jgi:FtsZ-binding cell division protein ZapB